MAKTVSQAPSVPAKKPSHRTSITGGVFAILSLIASSIGSAMIRTDFRPEHVANNTASKVDAVVTTTTVHVTASLLAVPFLVGGIVLALLAILFTLIRLRKVRAGGLLFSLVWLALSAWSLQLAIHAFNLLKANPS